MMTNGQDMYCRSGAESGKVRNWKGSESEGLGFNLCVALSCIVMSLILEAGDQRSEVGDQRLEVTSLLKMKVGQGQQGGSKS